ncbi:MAG TPA: 30S ribosomal protein S27ae [Candidatus Nanoarchaeia archaeon]|nr:30S ribosomal protein S27ae [Candidatus Nanoarchaeia archaeon]
MYAAGVKKNKFCPRCGAGVFLANHGNRLHCGKCGYTEFVTKK